MSIYSVLSSGSTPIKRNGPIVSDWNIAIFALEYTWTSIISFLFHCLTWRQSEKRNRNDLILKATDAIAVRTEVVVDAGIAAVEKVKYASSNAIHRTAPVLADVLCAIDCATESVTEACQRKLQRRRKGILSIVGIL